MKTHETFFRISLTVLIHENRCDVKKRFVIETYMKHVSLLT